MHTPDTAPGRAAFLDRSGPMEANVGRATVTTVLAIVAAAGAATAVSLVVLLTAAMLTARNGDGGVLAAIQTLSLADRPGRTPASYVYELSLAGLASLAAALALVAVAARRAGRPIRSFLTVAPRFRWRHALAGALIFLPVMGLEIVIDAIGSRDPFASPLFADHAALAGRLAYAGAAVVFLWFAALAEEMIFRGWLLQQTGAFTRNLLVILLVNAVLFSLIHADPSPGAFVTRCLLGAAWAWIVLRLGGVEFAAGAHFANNLGIALLARPVTFAVPEPAPFDIASVALQAGAVIALAAGVTWWTGRNSRHERTASV